MIAIPLDAIPIVCFWFFAGGLLFILFVLLICWLVGQDLFFCIDQRKDKMREHRTTHASGTPCWCGAWHGAEGPKGWDDESVPMMKVEGDMGQQGPPPPPEPKIEFHRDGGLGSPAAACYCGLKHRPHPNGADSIVNKLDYGHDAKHCSTCGAKTKLVVHGVHYRSETGEPVHRARMECPNKRWWTLAWHAGDETS